MIPCHLCGLPATCFNVFGAACDSKHLWFKSIDEPLEQSMKDLEIARKKFKKPVKKPEQ